MTNSEIDDYLPEKSPDQQTITGVTICHVSEDFDVYGGRARGGKDLTETRPPHKGWLGNPYPAEQYGRESCIRRFKRTFYDELRDRHDLTNAVLALRGRSVACYCRHSDEDEPACHLDVVNAALVDGHVQRIAQSLHDIPLTDEMAAEMCDPEDLL